MVLKVKVPPELIGGGVDEGLGKVADVFQRTAALKISKSLLH